MGGDGVASNISEDNIILLSDAVPGKKIYINLSAWDFRDQTVG
jgi:hypothetical protein